MSNQSKSINQQAKLAKQQTAKMCLGMGVNFHFFVCLAGNILPTTHMHWITQNQKGSDQWLPKAAYFTSNLWWRISNGNLWANHFTHKEAHLGGHEVRLELTLPRPS